MKFNKSLGLLIFFAASLFHTTTFAQNLSLEEAINLEWLDWMQNIHIQDVMATGYFTESYIQQLLDPAPQPGTVTYNIQYLCQSMDDLDAYQENEAARLQQDHNDKFHNQFVAFRTVLKRL